MPAPELLNPNDPGPPLPTEPAAAPPRRWRGLHAAALLACVALLLWCQHWLSSAQLSGGARPDDTSRYFLALLLTLPAVSGTCFFFSRLWRGRGLQWLALVLLGTECVLLIGAFFLLRALGTATTGRSSLLALGLVACLGAGAYLQRQLRRR